MNLLDFAEKISNLECRLNVTGIEPYFEKFWPLVRVRLFELSRDQKHISYRMKFRRILSFAAALLLSRVSFEKSDVLVLSAESDFGPKLGPTRRNTTRQAIRRIFDSSLRVTFANTATLGVTQVVSNAEGVSLLRALLTAKMYALFRKAFQTYNVPDQTELMSHVKKEFGFEASITSDILFVEELSKKFQRILLRVKPKIVIISVWYSRESMAMTLACKRLKISTVDYQHGAQNDIHPMYTNWNLRAESFETMPDIFWTWGEIPMRRINKWASKYSDHRAVLGGNLRVSLWKKENESLSPLSQNPQNEKPLIYVTLQGDEVFNEEILRVVSETHKRMNWVFRDHPRLPISSSLRSKIASESDRTARIVSKTPLYEDLQRASVHITGFSTCAFEAEVFGVPTIFTHENAFLGQTDAMETGAFVFAFTGKDISSSVDQLLQPNTLGRMNYIDMNTDPDGVIKRLLSGQV